MEDKSLTTLIVDLSLCKDKAKKIEEEIKDTLTNWINEVDFSQFKLNQDVHFGLLPVAIGGKAHDWSVLYHETHEKEILEPYSLTIKFYGNDVDVSCFYHGNLITAKIPLGVLASFNLFSEWFYEQEKNYKSNLYYIEQRIKSKEEASKSEEFAKWVEQGRKYLKDGLIEDFRLSETARVSTQENSYAKLP